LLLCWFGVVLRVFGVWLCHILKFGVKLSIVSLDDFLFEAWRGTINCGFGRVDICVDLCYCPPSFLLCHTALDLRNKNQGSGDHF
jgi:hypothetical protein